MHRKKYTNPKFIRAVNTQRISINFLLSMKINQLVFYLVILKIGIDFDEHMHFNSILNEDILKSNYFTSGVNKQSYLSLKYPFSFPNKFDVICLAEYEDTIDNDDGFIRVDQTSNKQKLLEHFVNKSSIIGFDEDSFKLKEWYIFLKFSFSIP